MRYESIACVNILDFFRPNHRRATKLYSEARELIDELRDYDGALEIAPKLRKLRHSGAFEIEGLVYSALDRNEDAVRVLREGLALAPSAWPNWMLLGSCLSNLERYDEALLAYDRAQACPGADRSAIELNRAIVETRRGDFEAALRRLDAIHSHADEGNRLRALAVRVDTLHDLGRDAEAVAAGLRTLNAWRDSNSTEGLRDIGAIALTVGKIRLGEGENRLALRLETIAWWTATRHEPLLWFIRELHALRSPDAKYYRLDLHGTISPESELHAQAQGFYTSADVVADSAEEALAFYMELVAPELDADLIVEKADALETRPHDVKGVYWVAGLVYYNETE